MPWAPRRDIRRRDEGRGTIRNRGVCSVLAAPLSRSGGSRGRWRLLILLEPRKNLVGEQRQVLDRVGVRHGACVAHHQEISHAATILAKIGDLVVDLGRRAAKQDGGIDQLLYAS